MSFQDWDIDNSWTLFLDRDGVINHQLIDDYVIIPDQFRFHEGVLECFEMLATTFERIIIVTNQQGIGKGLMTEEQLQVVHHFMRSEIVAAGGRIDAIYHAPQLEKDNHAFRKPGTGMALQAQKDFPEIDFQRSIMVGDSDTDMEFGKQLGMKTVLVSTQPEEANADLCVNDLARFSRLSGMS